MPPRLEGLLRQRRAGMAVAAGARYARLLARLRAGERIVLDGATGTEVERRGVPQLPNAWNGGAALSHPEILQGVHEDYYRSGAEFVISNTFACNAWCLRDAGEGEKVEEYNRRAVEIACAARDSAGGADSCVAGGISYWSFIDDYPSLDEIRDGVAGQAKVMAAAGADFIVLEMMIDHDRMLATLAGAQEAGLPVWVGISCGFDDEPVSAEAVDKQAVATELSADRPMTMMNGRDLLSSAITALADKDVDVLNIMHTNVEVTVHPLALHVALALTWLCCS